MASLDFLLKAYPMHPDVSIFEHYGKVFIGLHARFQQDMVNVGCNELTYSSLWTYILTHLEGVRREGIDADINYEEMYNGPHDKKYVATMFLAFYRMNLYRHMLASESKKNIEYAAIDERYHHNLAWFYRFRDKNETPEDDKVSHTWLN